MNLKLILGDQLNEQHSWLNEESKADTIFLLAESFSETNYVKHHIQKVCAFFLAMRNFAQLLQNRGFKVHYHTLNKAYASDSFSELLLMLLPEMEQKYQVKFTSFHYQLPDEYRLDKDLASLNKQLSIPIHISDSEHFLTTREELGLFFKGKKTYLMESFYRMMRKKHNILLDGSQEPLGGKWNFDAENRKPYDGKTPISSPPDFSISVKEIVELLKECGIRTFGNLEKGETINHPTSRKEALTQLKFFISKQLKYFGTFEDALYTKNEQLFHSKISFALNVKLLSPLEVVQAVEAYARENEGEISIAQVEGFIRQVLGWREYMRGVYWTQMPAFAEKNYFEHQEKLPEWFWTGETKMNCMRYCIGQSLDRAWAHHIQRLMVIGNFALLLGSHPDEVDAWYLGVYIDALEWVEITNTRGMSQFADGGLVATKPYVSSANYIQKMSDYCKGCHYDYKQKVGERACPFNSLYWHFFIRHEAKLGKNPRIGMAYQNLRKMNEKDKELLIEQAMYYIKHKDKL